MADWKVIDNTKAVLEAVEKAFQRAGETIGGTMERYAKEACPVDTGLLRNSITHGMAGEAPAAKNYESDDGGTKGSYSGAIPKPLFHKNDHLVVVGTNVRYAPYVELGARKRKAKPFLRPAVEQHLDEYKQILQDEFSSLS